VSTDASSPALPQPPSNVSALVVGLEKYGFTGSGTALPGAARSATRYASWLVSRGVCRPERITLMTTVGQDGDDELVADPDIRRLGHAGADHDFAQWINGYGPEKDDKLFLLFWVGHGFAYPGDPYEKLALLGSDADDQKLRHVELKDLLLAASVVAPKADVVAFVNACRAPVARGWEDRLENGFQKILTEQSREADRAGKQFVVYAAAHGQTTKMAGDDDITFADKLLSRLDTLPPGDGPRELFGAGLEDFVKELSQRQAGPQWTTYGYWGRDGKKELPPPPDDRDLNWDEWRNLVDIAAAVDDAHDTDMTWQVRWGAYYHALGLNGPENKPRSLTSVTDLITALRDRRSPGGQAPPLVIACDYVAHLPWPACRPELDAWCERWADNHVDGIQRRHIAQAKRPVRLPDRPYLSISVDDYPGPSPGRYQLVPLLSAIGEPCPRPKRGPVTESRIPAEVEAVINEAMADGTVPSLDALVVELVLPRRLVQRGWRPEYMKPEHLGIDYAVVIRDAEVARGWGKNGQVARNRAREKFRAMAEFVPDESSSWSGQIEWFTCEDAREPTAGEIAVALRNKFCIGLGRKKISASARSRGNGSARGLADSIERGVPIVISMLHAKGCHKCVLAPASPSPGGDGAVCEIPAVKSRVSREVDKNPNGLPDLPYILRDIRTDLGVSSELQLGVYMEDPSRLWPGYLELKSQYRPDGSQETSGKGH
jgi:hypothetical protein